MMVGLAVVIALRDAEYRRRYAWFRTTSLWLFFALSAPFVAIVLLAPFKIGALVNAVTTPTTSNVDIIGGLLIAMWNYMGWDNASTIATEVERPQRTYPRAMLVAVVIVVVNLHCSGRGDVDDRPSTYVRGRRVRGRTSPDCSAVRCCALRWCSVE